MGLAELDPVIHAPKRLAIMAILAASEWVDFSYLRHQLGLSDSDLSKQMRALQEAAYAKVVKRGAGPGASTWFRMTREGRRAFDGHIGGLRALVLDVPPAPVGAGVPRDPDDRPLQSATAPTMATEETGKP